MRPNLPSRKQIAAAWAFWLVEQDAADSVTEVMDDLGWCWACGMADGSTLERAHITARSDGGSDEVENLHLLCHVCHKSSEFLTGEDYFTWLENRTFMDASIDRIGRITGGATMLRLRSGLDVTFQRRDI